MNDQLPAAERADRGPDTIETIHDKHAAALFQYCWFLLQDTDAAQAALCDTLIVAAAHLQKIGDPAQLLPWLYAIARVECGRRHPSAVRDPDSLRDRTREAGPDPALMAWHAVMGIGAQERESLELSFRHGLAGPDVASVLGVAGPDAAALLARGRAALEQALAGEVLAHTRAARCRGRAAILADWDGKLTAGQREQLVRHARNCPSCAQSLPRSVSVAKVFSLLPMPEPPPDTRRRAMACLRGPQMAEYRASVVARGAAFDDVGLPVRPNGATEVSDAGVAEPAGQAQAGPGHAAPAGPGHAAPAGPGHAAPARQPQAGQPQAGPAEAGPGQSSRRRRWVGLAAVVTAIVLGVGFVVGRLGGFETMLRGIVPGSVASGAPSGADAPTARPGSADGARGPAHTSPSRGSAIAPSALLGVLGADKPAQRKAGSALPPAQQPLGGGLPAAGHLLLSADGIDLGTSVQGKIVLSAEGGPVTWSASTSSPKLSLSSYEGTLAAGANMALAVMVSSGNRPGRATFIVGPGNMTVAVTWSGTPGPAPSPPGSGSPSPTPSASPTAAPPPAPSPSPTPSSTASPTAQNPAAAASYSRTSLPAGISGARTTLQRTKTPQRASAPATRATRGGSEAESGFSNRL